ncbi:MAG TPA: hypothetical protein VGI40_25350 [Pirellulaceae bacterium]|jgi:hypothetical protein
MSVTIQVDLPEEIIREARQLGLLESKRMTAMLEEEVRRRRAGQELKRALDQVRSAPGDAMTMDEINAEIESERKERSSLLAALDKGRNVHSIGPLLRDVLYDGNQPENN